MSRIKIVLAKSSGFCFGVRRAIGIAEVEAKKTKPIFMLNDLVHNEEVIKYLEKIGIKKIKSLDKSLKEKVFLLCAHGEPQETIIKASLLGCKIVDATCPMVKHIHKIAQDIERRRRTLIIIGDKDHAEVVGILGQIKSDALVIDPKEKLNLKEIKKIKTASAVVQSTQDLEVVLKIKKVLEKYIPDFEFFNTICKPTEKRQKEIKELANNNQVVIIIGSKKSANTKRLYQIAKKINKNTYWITNQDQLKKIWFKDKKSIAITAGASTPDWTINKVLKKIKEICK